MVRLGDQYTHVMYDVMACEGNPHWTDLELPLVEGADGDLQIAVTHVHKRHIARFLALSRQVLLVDTVRQSSWERGGERVSEWGGGVSKWCISERVSE